MNIVEIFDKGGLVMWPLLALSILAVGVILERVCFWAIISLKEEAVVNRVLDAAISNLHKAKETVLKARRLPIGRYLYAPLKLTNPNPEVFRLALEASADEELAAMRRGDKILEAVIALSPLLGLLGTVLGLINSLGSIRLSDLGTGSTDGVTQGIGESLISTAAGLIVAIISLAFYRLFQAFQYNQVKVFRKSGSELELIYRQKWWQGEEEETDYSADVAQEENLNSPSVEVSELTDQ